MAIIKINSDEESVKFLKNQSSILHTSDTNNITVNAVNVIVDRPKVGDVMCVTRYKDKNNSLLPADKQKVIWIDGLSINPKQLSQKYEPVGICVAVKGNKAMVRYREEKSYKWAAGQRWELTGVGKQIQSVNNKSLTFNINLNGVIYAGNNGKNAFTYKYDPLVLGKNPPPIKIEPYFVKQLNAWFKANSNLKNFYSAELVESDTDLPITGTPTTDSYRIIVNERFNGDNSLKSFSMQRTDGLDPFENFEINGTGAIGKHIKTVSDYYLNNGFTRYWEGGCCRAKYYDYVQETQNAPTGEIKNINIVIGGIWDGKCPARLVDFTDTSNEKCQVLRKNFATYDEYIDSFMVKCPCGKGGVITEFPSGKENTYKLANCTFLDNKTDKQEILYPAANWAASIDINAPELQAGNWWLPSAAEMAQMMRDINFWGNINTIGDNTDIVNRVLLKLTSVNNSGWSMLSASTFRWASSRYDQNNAHYYGGGLGILGGSNFYNSNSVAPITLYEF